MFRVSSDTACLFTMCSSILAEIHIENNCKASQLSRYFHEKYIPNSWGGGGVIINISFSARVNVETRGIPMSLL